MQGNFEKKTAAIILAAGRGGRMGDAVDGPKQYQVIEPDSGKTVLSTTADAFLKSEYVSHIVVVIHPDDEDLYRQSVCDHSKFLSPVFGGKTRQESGLRGLQALEKINPDLVLIHDAARPFVDPALIERTIAAIDHGVAALPAVGISDTVKQAEHDENGPVVSATIPRDTLFLAQTPQGFEYKAILESHQRADGEKHKSFTDDCAVAEWAGMKTKIVEGSIENTKITTFNDLIKVRKMNALKENPKVLDVRSGIGYDVHRLIPGDGVILCGIKLPSNKKLEGHSDADVALHALTDALLGTIGDGDIGSHFPPSDPLWAGADSDQFLAHACSLVRQKSGTITNLDVTIVCEEPKIGPYRENMRQSLANICGMPTERVSVKATTHERIGAMGRGEGISAMATASVVITE